MVHALGEIQRVLVPNGSMIDLRPMSDQWRVEVFSKRETRETGRATDLPLGLEDDNAANQAVANAESKRWFAREQDESFFINYVWDSPSEMEKWVDEEWKDFVGLDKKVRRAARSAWALGDGDSRVRISVKMTITKWRKL